jgi:hypothetical protein
VLSGRGLCVGLITCPEKYYLSTVLRRCVWYRNPKNCEAIARVGPQCQKYLWSALNIYPFLLLVVFKP